MAASSNAAPQLIGTSGDSLREAFGKALAAHAKNRDRIVVLDADIAGGTGVHHFRKAHPERFIQCGIAEQNMMAMAGGLAATGPCPWSRLSPSSACAPSSRPAFRSPMHAAT